tara:strand:- start:131 stop:574 length:444 start_codon:yes stop_codon:yes gene_type:complete
MLKNEQNENQLSQISILKEKNISNIYASISIPVKDIANNKHVLCLGIDLHPFLNQHTSNSKEIILDIENQIMKNGGSGHLSKTHESIIDKVAKILNIKWVSKALKNKVNVICTRSTECPRNKQCDDKPKVKCISWINQIKKEIISSK